MDRKQLDRVEQLFQLLEGSSRDVQKSELARLAGDDEKVRAKVAALLQAASETLHPAEPKLVAGLRQAGAAKLSELCEELPVGTRFGDYVIMEALAEGGFGRVYKVAERTDVSRIVALKVIKAGFDTREVLARFRMERQVLANMNHRNIARLFRAGSTDAGRPYFVMEYVPGEPITKFADQNQLSISDRLRLFQQVCEAIGHAHQKAVIHRDIKSSNILAYMADGTPVVKVIDFGIAKVLTGDRLTQHSIVNTRREAVIGSFESMSPEQAEGRPDIDTLTDVYSLGVVLYELLAGVKPFDLKVLDAMSEKEARHVIREKPPARPSAQLTSIGGEAAKEIANARRSKVEALVQELRSELERIPLMAMRKERAMRYTSPLALSEDIHNYLTQRPLNAVPESITYRTRKFARRHRAALLASAASLVGLIIGIGAYIRGINIERTKTDNALYYANSQKTAAQAAESRTTALLAEANQVNRILVLDKKHDAQLRHILPTLNFDAIGFSDVIDFLRDTTGYQISLDWDSVEAAGVDRNAPITANLPHERFDACLDAILHSASHAGSLFWVIDDNGSIVIGGQSMASKVVITAGIDVLPIADKPAQLDSLIRQIREKLDRKDDQIFKSAGTLWVRAPVQTQERIVRTYENIGLGPVSRTGSYETSPDQIARVREDQSSDRKAVPTVPKTEESAARKVSAASTPPTANAQIGASAADIAWGRAMGAKLRKGHVDLETTAKEYRESIAILRTFPLTDPDRFAVIVSDYASTLMDMGKPREAEPLSREAIVRFREALPKQGSNLSATLSLLANVLASEGQLPEARVIAQEAVDIARSLSPAEPLRLASASIALADVLVPLRKPDEAESLLRDAVAALRKNVRFDDPFLPTAIAELGAALEAQGKLEEAATEYREALSIRRRTPSADPITISQNLERLGWVLTKEHKYPDAEVVVHEAIDIRRASGVDDGGVAFAFELLGTIQSNSDRFTDAERSFREALRIRRTRPSDGQPDLALAGVGSVLVRRGQYQDAEPFLREALAIRKRDLGIVALPTKDTAADLITVLEKTGRSKEATQLLKEFKLDNSTAPQVGN